MATKQDAPTERAHLSTDDATLILDAFAPSAQTTAQRVLLVGQRMETHRIPATAVFEDVRATAELAGRMLPEGFSKSSIGNAATVYSLYQLAGIHESQDKQRNRTHMDLIKLIDECRYRHGAKATKQTIGDTIAPLLETITPLTRFRAVWDALTDLYNRDQEDKGSTNSAPTFQTYIRALQKARDILEGLPDDVYEKGFTDLTAEQEETLKGAAHGALGIVKAHDEL